MALATPSTIKNATPVEEKVQTAVVDDTPYLDSSVEESTAATVVAVVDQPRTGQLVTAHPIPEDEDDGFGDLDQDLGWRSFPMFKLSGNLFESTEGHTLPSLDVVIHKQRRKAAIKARNGQEDGIPMAYAYVPEGVRDEQVDFMSLQATDYTPVSEHVAQWKSEGEMEPNGSPVVSIYVELLVSVYNTGSDLDGEMAILNIAPMSKNKLAGYRQTLIQKGRVSRGKAYRLDEVLTKVQPGAKIQKGKNTWYPWDFKFAGLLDA